MSITSKIQMPKDIFRCVHRNPQIFKFFKKKIQNHSSQVIQGELSTVTHVWSLDNLALHLTPQLISWSLYSWRIQFITEGSPALSRNTTLLGEVCLSSPESVVLRETKRRLKLNETIFLDAEPYWKGVASFSACLDAVPWMRRLRPRHQWLSKLNHPPETTRK